MNDPITAKLLTNPCCPVTQTDRDLNNYQTFSYSLMSHQQYARLPDVSVCYLTRKPPQQDKWDNLSILLQSTRVKQDEISTTLTTHLLSKLVKIARILQITYWLCWVLLWCFWLSPSSPERPLYGNTTIHHVPAGFDWNCWCIQMYVKEELLSNNKYTTNNNKEGLTVVTHSMIVLYIIYKCIISIYTGNNIKRHI